MCRLVQSCSASLWRDCATINILVYVTCSGWHVVAVRIQLKRLERQELWRCELCGTIING